MWGRDISFWTLAGLGSLLALMYVGATVVRVSGGAPLGVGAVQLLIGLVLPVLLVGGGFWLSETDHPPERRWKVVMWSFGGLGTLTAVTGWGLYLRVLVPSVSAGLMEILILNAQAGAVAGLVVGAYDARAEERAEKRERELEKRKKAETRYRSLFEKNPVVMWEENLSEAKEYVDGLKRETDDLERYLDRNPDELDEVMSRVNIIDVNENALDYYGAETKDELMRNLGEIMTEESREANKRLWLSVAQGETEFRAETVSKTLSGERRNEILEMYVPEPYADDYSRAYITGTDITERKERERELEKLTEEYNTIIEATEDSIFLVNVEKVGEETKQGSDVEFRYERVNESHEELTGITKEEMRGQTPREVVGDEVGAELEENYRRCMEEKEPISYQEEVEFPEGDKIWQTTLAPAIVNGEVTRIVGISRDVTERVERERELERYEAFIENSSEVMIHVSESGEILYESPTPDHPLGYEPNEQINHDIFSYIHPDDREEVVEGYDRLVNDPRVQTDEMRIRVKESTGGYAWVEVTGADQTDTEVGGVIVSLRGVSEKVKREQELRETKEELERSNEHLEQFAYVASHDMKEPLRMVSSYLELLDKEYADELDDQAHDYIEFAVDGAERMYSMIEDLLTYSRVRTHGRNPQPVDTESVVDEVLRDLRVLAEENGADVEYEPLPQIQGDRSQMVQLFQNLIKNGIEHSEEEPEIRIGVNEKTDEYEFYVEDDGKGIPQEQQEDVFEVFEQGHRTDGGTGIGLAICNRIVEEHGGDIRVESGEGEGSRFYFTIPK